MQAEFSVPGGKFVKWFLLPLLFLGSCAALAPVGMSLADPMAHAPLAASAARPFPVLAINGRVPRVIFISDLHDMPKLGPGSSFLVPPGQERDVERQLNARLSPHVEGRWALRVRRKTAQSQHLQLYWVNDGYCGGGYDATSVTIVPRYRMSTGPGFAFIAGGIALLINVAMWSAVAIVLRLLLARRTRRAGIA